MPKISKVSRPSTKPKDAKPIEEREGGYTCSRCGKTFKRQKNNFPAAQSSIYKGNNGFLTVCSNCVDQLYQHYRDALGNGEAAMRRICMKFDIYWNPDIYRMLTKVNTSSSRVRAYISRTYLVRYVGKTYDDTLDEDVTGGEVVTLEDLEDEDGDQSGESTSISAKTIQFWGGGFGADFYRDLEARYDNWTRDLPKPLTPAQEALYKQICLQEININRNIMAGKSIEQGQNALNNLLGSLNEKPRQQVQNDASAEYENTPMGVWIKRWEDKRPVPEDDSVEEPKLIKYLQTWFFGHLCKSLGIKNIYSQVYEDEIEKYRVHKPEFESDDDDVVIADMTSGQDGDPDDAI